MRKTLALIAFVLIAGCGTNFAGDYSGTLTVAAPCSDGSRVDQTNQVVWPIDADSPDWALNLPSCMGIPLADNGNVLVFGQHTCPPSQNATSTSVFSYTGGSATLTGGALSVAATISIAITTTGGASGTCSGTLSGTLSR